LLAPYNGSIAKIQKYLELNSLRPQNPNLFTFSLKNPTPDSPLRWALTKMDLAELLLALSHARVLRTSFVTQRTPPATLLRGEIIFPDGAEKTNFPAPHFLRHPTHAAGEPRSSGRGGPGSAPDFEREL